MVDLLPHRNRVLLVKLKDNPEHTDANGLVIPEDAGIISAEGIVFKSEPDSVFKEGDSVVFAKINKDNDDGLSYEKVVIDAHDYYAIHEGQIWSFNEKPHGFIFIKPLSEMTIGDGELIIPEQTKGIPQKGIIVEAPTSSYFKKEDIVQYRKREGEIYPQVFIDGVEMDVLREHNIFTANGIVSPHRMVIRIDKQAQMISRTTAENGLTLSPMYIAMLRNLQYGIVDEIGEEAKKMYPGLEAGDSVVIHHSLEAQDYRILRREIGQHGGVKYEYIIANCFDVNSREIFAKINCKWGKLKHKTISPFGNYIFLDWDFDLFEQKPVGNSEFITSFDFDLQNYRDKDSLLSACMKLQEGAANAYGQEYAALVEAFKTKNPEDEQQYHEAQVIGNKIEALKRDATVKGAELKRNHVVVANVAFPKNMFPDKVLTRYRGTYPITLQGKKYLIVELKDILSTYQKHVTETDMAIVIKPTLDRILIEPIVPTKGEYEIIIPDSLQEPPNTGIVTGIGDMAKDKPGFPKEGDTVMFRRGRGVELPHGDKSYLLMGQDDVLAIMTESI